VIATWRYVFAPLAKGRYQTIQKNYLNWNCTREILPLQLDVLRQNPFQKTILELKSKMISDKNISDVISKARDSYKLLNQEDDSSIFYDLSLLKEKINSTKKLFPGNTIHAVAIKANPISSVLSFISLLGVGFEAASLPEIHMAINSGISPNNVIFDSPSKTIEELNYALDSGIHINADSIMELERIDQILKTKKTRSTIGVRINPQVGTGLIKATSVAETISKFGVPMNEKKEELKQCFEKYQWLSGVHVHVGSQGCPVELIVQGIKKVYDFSCDVNRYFEKNGKTNRIVLFDLGGGLPVQYNAEISAISMNEYVSKLKYEFPKLFDGNFKLITEFGRFFHANCAWAISKVEYIKKFNTRNIAMIHLGADMFLRKCYNPNDWHHNISVMSNDGILKSGFDVNNYDIAGPLCFSGDIIARDIRLPRIEEGDYIIIHDVGAYTFGMWSRYNSRQMPKIIGYDEDNIKVIKERESIDDVLRFWE
jgi:diaminopimelate decarboxylase